eukprot:TRINITY_DN116_c0_g2_i5.p3 TRINITY_DN116_c0_g2~~TRINITY_DN116_c0_g2_i5.p3  ORF type:complete len:246 (+),score=50.72 TRINITY_DN116_c0_g2_i5:2169-2906(+)
MIDSGLPMTLWARRSESLSPFVQTSATLTTDIAEFGRNVDHVGICVLDDGAVRQVFDALLSTMKPGSRIVIHSTINPGLCASLAKEAAAKGIDLLDAPVSGGGRAAAVGKLTVMVGGDAAVFEAALPILQTFGSLIVRLGEAGAGQMAKLINNSLMAANFAMGHHALEAGVALGIDLHALANLINSGSGRSFGFETRAKQSWPQSFAHGAKLLSKDVHLLGAALDSEVRYAPFRDVALPVLKIAL